MEMKINMMKKKNFYSNVDWNYMQGYSLWQLPKDPEGKGWDKLLEMCATFDLHEIEMKERKYNKKHFRNSLLMRLVKFLLSWIPKDEFDGAYKKWK